MMHLILLAGVATSPADPTIEAVRCTEVAFSQTVERRDVDAFKAFIDADSRWGNAANPLVGPDAIAEAWSPFFAPEGPAIVWRPDTVWLRGDGLALSHGPFRMVTPGTDEERWGTFTSIWQQTDGGDWRIIFDHGGDVGMTPTDEQRALIDGPTGCDAGADQSSTKGR